MTIGKRIKLLRNDAKITQEELAKKIGVATQTIFKYEKEIVTNIPLEKIAEIATALNTTPAYLMGWSAQKNKVDDVTVSSLTETIRVPVLGHVAAGIPIEAIEDIIDYEEVTADFAKGKQLFGLKIKGRSMEPMICNGDVVIVKCQNSIDNNHIGIVLVNGDEATCKKVKFNEKGVSLISLNPDYDPMFYTPEEIENLPVKIIGEVVELRRKF